VISVREFNDTPRSGVDVARLEEYIDLYIKKTAQFGKLPPGSPIEVHLLHEFRQMTQDNLDKITETYRNGGWILKLDVRRNEAAANKYSDGLSYKFILTPLDPPVPAGVR